MTRTLLLSCCLLLIGLCPAAEAARLPALPDAQVAEVQKFDRLLPGVALNGDVAVAMAGDLAIVGRAVSGHPGTAVVMGRQASGQWQPIKILAPSDGTPGDFFGASVAIGPQIAVVAALGSRGVYVFERHRGGSDQWGQAARIDTSAFGIGHFVTQIALTGLELFVAARLADPGGVQDAGAVHLYRPGPGGLTNWIPIATLTAPTPAASDQFGYSLAVADDVLAVNVHTSTPDSTSRVEVFRRDAISGNWAHEARIDQNGAPEPLFGANLAVAAGRLAISSYHAVHLYARAGSSWNPVQRIVGGGQALAWLGTSLIVGRVFGADDGVVERYREQAGVWIHAQTLRETRPDGLFDAFADEFGEALASNGEDLLVASGSATPDTYVFRMQEPFQVVQQVHPAGFAPTDEAQTAMAASGDFVAVARPDDGEVCVYERAAGGIEAWRRQQCLADPAPAPGRRFGAGLAFDGALLLIGASYPLASNQSGEVRVYQRNLSRETWEAAGLVAGQAVSTPNPLFGSVIAARLGRLVSVSAGQKLAVYALDGGTGTNFVQRQVIDKPAGFSSFERLSLSTDWLAVGDPGHNGGRGAVGLFRWTGTAFDSAPRRLLQPSLLNAGDNYGRALAIEGDTLVVGAREFGTQSLLQGRVFVHIESSGGPENFGLDNLIEAPVPAERDGFGLSLALGDERLVVGAPGDEGATAIRTAAYVFERMPYHRAAFALRQRFEGADWGSMVGQAVALAGDTLFVGAPEAGEGAGPARPRHFALHARAGGAGGPAHGQWVVPDGLSAAARYAEAIASEGDWMAVGAPAQDVDGREDQGVVFLYRRELLTGAYQLVHTLVAPDAQAGDEFGFALAMAGGRLLVGAYNRSEGSNADQGAAYLFERDLGGAGQWGLRRKLLPDDGGVSDFFGWSVALSAERALIGANCKTLAANVCQGRAYLYERQQGGADQWGLLRSFTAADGADFDRYGSAVALAGDDALIGSIFAMNPSGFRNGAVYLYRRDQGGAGHWGQVRKITPVDAQLDGSSLARFGERLVVEGSDALVGAPNATSFQVPGRGAVYALARDATGTGQWGQTGKLAAADGATGDGYGSALALRDGRALIGAPGADPGGEIQRGAVYVLQQQSLQQWRVVGRIVPADGAAIDQLGTAVAFAAGRYALGAPTRAIDGQLRLQDAQIDGADLGISILEEGAVPPAGVFRYRIQVRNVGRIAAAAPIVAVSVPPHTHAGLASGWQCSPNSQAGAVCSLMAPNLLAGEAGYLDFDLVAEGIPASLGQLPISAGILLGEGDGFDPFLPDNTASYNAFVDHGVPDLIFGGSGPGGGGFE